MISVRGPDESLLLAKQEWQRVLGYSEADIRERIARGEDVLALFFPDPDECARARAFNQTNAGQWGHFRPTTRYGTVLETLWIRAHLSDGTVINLGQDITERIRLEDELRQAQRMESVGRLARGIAHDFNNLLTALLGYADLAALHTSGRPQLETSVREIRRAAERATVLTSRRSGRWCAAWSARRSGFGPCWIPMRRTCSWIETSWNK